MAASSSTDKFAAQSNFNWIDSSRWFGLKTDDKGCLCLVTVWKEIRGPEATRPTRVGRQDELRGPDWSPQSYFMKMLVRRSALRSRRSLAPQLSGVWRPLGPKTAQSRRGTRASEGPRRRMCGSSPRSATRRSRPTLSHRGAFCDRSGRESFHRS